MQRCARRVGQQVGMVPRLRNPDRVELGFDMVALRIEIIFLTLQIHTHSRRFSLIEPHSEKFAKRASLDFLDCCIEPFGSHSDFSALITFLAFCFAVGLEATPLVEMEQNPADFVRQKFGFERAAAQRIRIALSDQLSLITMCRHQAEANKAIEKG